MTAIAKRKSVSIAFWAACAALPIILFCGLAIWGGVYPFGGESFLTEDLKYQYIDFFTWFRGVLLGENSIYYSFAQGLGSNTWGLYSYYAASPFNLLLLLFNEDNLTLAVFVTTALKLSCIALAMGYFLRRRFELNYLWSLLLALSFTFSSWTVTQLRNPMWLDALILLPLGATCCWRVIREGKFLGLALVVAADIICCWYMAYMSILFFCLFVLFELGAYALRGNRIDARFVGGRALRFAAGMLLGLALSAWTFVPTVLAMLGGSGTLELSGMYATTPKDLVKSVLPGMWRLNLVPQFYTGLVTEIAALFFLLNPRIPGKLRLLTLAFTLFIAASAIIIPIQYVWCGFRVPNGFYSRTAFLTSFMMVWMAAYCIKMGFGKKRIAETQQNLASHMRQRTKVWRLPAGAISVLMAITVVELVVNGHLSWNQLYVGYPQSTYEAYVDEADAELTELNAFDDSSFYRMDKTYTRVTSAALNEGIARGFSQLSSYSSASNPRAIAFLNAIGYSSQGEFSTRYSTPILATDSLLGVKYASATEHPVGYLSCGFPALSNGAELYQNPYALGLGFLVDTAVEDVDLNSLDNPFERQSALFQALTGSSESLYTPLSPTANSESDFSWTVDAPAGSVGYAFVMRDPQAGSYNPVSLNIGDKSYEEAWRFDNSPRALNQLSDTSTQVNVSITPWTVSDNSPDARVPENTGCVFYALNMEAFERAIDILSDEQLQPTVAEGDHVSGSVVSTGTKDLVLSIPYDKGWTIAVNGSEVEPTSLFGGGMMSIPVTEGENKIEMTYRSPGTTIGLACSGFALIAVAALGVSMAARQRR